MLTREQFIVLNDYYNTSVGRAPVFSDRDLNHALSRSHIKAELMQAGYVDQRLDYITQQGLAALEPYRVSGAVILAAGPSTRCIPLSLEMPKGMFEVKGEKLLERQIHQLREAGIDDITVVVGHMREQLAYLADACGVRLIDNADYMRCNNIHSLYLAKEHLSNAYICSCDDYFTENPFNRFEYASFYAGIREDRATDEMYVYTDEDRRIVKMATDQPKGQVILGHSYWTRDFAKAFLALAEADRTEKKYTHAFWEWMVKDFIDDLPAFYFKEYAPREITEFDYFDDLRRFDSAYGKHTHSRIIKNIVSVFHCDETEIMDFRNVSEGMTNTSFIFRLHGVDYIYRHPGEGTEKIINRRNEKHSLEAAKKWGIDSTYVSMDVAEGWKISSFVTDFREPSYADFEDSEKIIRVLRRLHSLPETMDYGLRPFEDAEAMERLLQQKNPACLRELAALKQKIAALYARTQGDGVRKCFCHGDTYKPNWMLLPDGNVILIDWEYAGYADPGIDVGYYIVDAMYSSAEAERFIAAYLGDTMTEQLRFHYLAYCALIAYYWYVWAMYREACGAVMGEALTNWHAMAVRFADYVLDQYQIALNEGGTALGEA